jgi:hypothetical protein
MPRWTYTPERETLTRRDHLLHKPGDNPGALSILVSLLFLAAYVGFVVVLLATVRERPRVATPPHHAAEWNWYVR